MARLPRLTVAGHVHHVIQRGNNRQLVFARAEDRVFFLELLEQNARAIKVAVHGYVLMDDHFHLLMTPETPEGLPQLMQAIGRRYVRYFNTLQGRSGTLWEGRFRSTVLEAATQLLPCMAYMDLNPVRAGLVAQPQDFAWSSYRHYSGLQPDKRLTPPAPYWDLGNTPFAREAAYSSWVQSGLGSQQVQALTHATLHGWALGSDAFLSQLEELVPRRVRPSKAGRPVRVA